MCHVQCAMCNDVNVNAVSLSPCTRGNCVSVSLCFCFCLCVGWVPCVCACLSCAVAWTFACLLSFRRSVSCGLRQNTCDAPVTTTKTSQRTIHQLHTLPFKKAQLASASWTSLREASTYLILLRFFNKFGVVTGHGQGHGINFLKRGKVMQLESTIRAKPENREFAPYSR